MPKITGASKMSNEATEGYNSRRVTVFSADTITNQEREAAEVLLLMGNAGARKTIITEHRSVPPVPVPMPAVAVTAVTTESHLYLNAKSNQSIVASVPPFTVNNNVSVITEPVGFVPVISTNSNSCTSSFSEPRNFSNNFNVERNVGNNSSSSHSAISYAPDRSPSISVTSHNVPISVVKRQETIGSRPQKTIYPSPPPISISQNHNQNQNQNQHQPQPAITIRPTPITPSPINNNINSNPKIEFGVLARTEHILHTLEPILPTESKSQTNDKNLSESVSVSYVGPMQQQSTLSQQQRTSSDRYLQQMHFTSNLRDPPPNPHPTGMPSWIISNVDNSQGAAGVIRIVSPSGGSVNGNNLNVSGNGILLRQPGQTTMSLIHFTPSASICNNNTNNNNSSHAEFLNLQTNSRVLNENLEQQKLHQNKLMKKALRAKIPLSRDATKAIMVDEFTIPREFWAKAFVQSDICHAAGILFKALFTPEEIQNCTLRGRNGTFLLDLQKRSAIFRAVGWMKNKNQNPYSFDSKQLSNTEFLTQEEKMIIEKKVFVERRYQTSRKIREVPYTRKQNKETKRNSQGKKNNANNLNSNLNNTDSNPPPVVVSSEESNPPLEIIVKAEPIDVLEYNQNQSNNEENTENVENSSVIIKTEREEPMDTDEDVKVNSVAHLQSEGENKPPSPKQMKFAAH